MQKGQESAPFELLIAMIVMSFVIIIGFNALDRLSIETCKGNLNQNLGEIRSSIESVVKNKGKDNVSFELPNCFMEEDSRLSIIERDELAYCSAVCGGSIAQCTVLQFSSPEYTEVKCLHISSATTFPDSADTCDPGILEPDDAYEAVDWKDPKSGILPGQYTLIRRSNLFSDAPVICAFRRVG